MVSPIEESKKAIQEKVAALRVAEKQVEDLKKELNLLYTEAGLLTKYLEDELNGDLKRPAVVPIQTNDIVPSTVIE